MIEPREWKELSAILESYAPGNRVWAFGSRATGRRVRRFSDLDIVIGGEELPFDQIAKLREALDESRLPFKVDIVQISMLTPEFRSRIEPEMVPIHEPNGRLKG
jgi:predicted nucleotidyltransferase